MHGQMRGAVTAISVHDMKLYPTLIKYFIKYYILYFKAKGPHLVLSDCILYLYWTYAIVTFGLVLHCSDMCSSIIMSWEGLHGTVSKSMRSRELIGNGGQWAGG